MNCRTLVLPLMLVVGLALAFSCSKKVIPIPNPTAGVPVTDIDGNVYKTVVIGSQEWMAENLKVTRYRNGDTIPNVTDTTWLTLQTGAYCWYNNDTNDTAAYKSIYGALYNWYSIVDGRNIAPEGWHIPTDAEWTALTTFLGGDSIAGGKLKEIGTLHWYNPLAGTTNETGFTARPGGCLSNTDIFINLGDYGYWWTGTADSTSTAWFRGMYYNNSVFRNNVSKISGFSVRCIKN